METLICYLRLAFWFFFQSPVAASCWALLLRAFRFLLWEKKPDGLTQGLCDFLLNSVAGALAVILDSAHNPHGMVSLKETLQEYQALSTITPRVNSLSLIVGFLEDKNALQMGEILFPLSDRVIVTRPKSERGLDPKRFCQMYQEKKPSQKLETAETFLESMNRATVSSNGENEAICIAGSIYLVGEAFQFLQEKGAKCVESLVI